MQASQPSYGYERSACLCAVVRVFETLFAYASTSRQQDHEELVARAQKRVGTKDGTRN